MSRQTATLANLLLALAPLGVGVTLTGCAEQPEGVIEPSNEVQQTIEEQYEQREAAGGAEGE